MLAMAPGPVAPLQGEGGFGMGTAPVARKVVSSLVVALAGLTLVPIAGSAAPSRAGGNADTVDGFHAVGCATKIANRGVRLVATCQNGRLPSNIIAIAPNAKKLSGKTLAQVVAMAEADLHCIGCVEAVEIAGGSIDPDKLLASGAPTTGQVLTFDGSGFAWQSTAAGDVTGVGAGTGLNGGGTSGDVVLAVAPSFRLPQNCDTGDLTAWDGAAWGCAIDQDTTYAAGGGLDLAGTTFSVDFTEVQARVSGSCPVIGIGVINGNGTATCEVDDRTTFGPTGFTSISPGAESFAEIFPSVTIGADGLPIISWFDGGTAKDIKVTHCSDPRCTNSTTSDVDTGDNAGHTSIAIGSDGFPIVTFRNASAGELRFVRCANVACTVHAPSVLLDGAGAPDMGNYSSVTVAADGNPFVAYQSVTDQSLKIVHCTNLACTTKDPPRTIDNTGDAGTGVTGEYASATIGADGFPRIAYYSRSGQITTALRIVNCDNVGCADPPVGIGFTVTTLDNTADDGQFASLMMGGDGLPVISYMEAGTDDLKVAHCQTPNCSTVHLEVIDSTDAVGGGTSITAGPYGFPVVAFRDQTNTALKLAYCSSFDCSSKLLVPVDNTADVGIDPAITLGVDGNPVMAFFDADADDLRIAGCTSPWCGSNYRRR
jgi:hypothetical protein